MLEQTSNKSKRIKIIGYENTMKGTTAPCSPVHEPYRKRMFAKTAL